MESELIPPLRPGVSLVPRDDEAFPGALVDRALGRNIKLDGRGVELARALDIPQTLARLAQRTGSTEERAARAVAGFAGLHLLATEEARALAADAEALAAIEAAEPATVPLLIRDDARFSCTMCGSCCGGHNLGPVFDDVLEGLAEELDALRADADSAKGLFFAMGGAPDSAGGEQVLCHQHRGSCVFLADDGRCRIHATLGADAKPRACRIFPYELIATPRGVAVTIQRECRSFNEARLGARLVDDEPHLRHLLSLTPRLSSTPRIIYLAPERPISWGAYERLEGALHDATDSHDASPIEALIAARGILLEALGRGDLDASAQSSPRWDRGLSREIKRGKREGSWAHLGTSRLRERRLTQSAREMAGPDASAAPDPMSEPEAAALGQRLDALTAQATRAIDALASAIPAPDEGIWIRAELLDHLRAALACLRPDLRRVLAPLRHPEQRALFVDHLHHALMSKALARAPSLLHGLARLTFGWLLTKALAIHRAREVKRRHLVTQDLMDGLVVTSFALRHEDLLRHLLPTIDGALIDLFVTHLPALVAHRGAIEAPDRRIELVKF